MAECVREVPGSNPTDTASNLGQVPLPHVANVSRDASSIPKKDGSRRIPKRGLFFIITPISSHTHQLHAKPPHLFTNNIIWHGSQAVLSKKKLMRKIINSTVSPSCHFGMHHQGQANVPGILYIVGMKCDLKDRIIVASTCRRSVPYSLFVIYITRVWTANCVSMMTEMLHLYYKFTISCRCQQAWTTLRINGAVLIGWICTLWGPCPPSVALIILSNLVFLVKIVQSDTL